MSDDEKRERVVAACRVAITTWIETGDDKSGRQLRDGLHALSACRAMHRDLREKPGRPKRRKAA